MHTFTGRKSLFQANSDLSGDCYIVETETGRGIDVPCDDILDFVAEYIRSRRIGEIEQMSTKDILGL